MIHVQHMTRSATVAIRKDIFLNVNIDKQINIDESKFYDSNDKHLFIGAITSDENLKFEESDKEWSIDLDTNGKLISFKIDSGAQVNILPLKEYYRLQNRPKLQSQVSNCLLIMFLHSMYQTQSVNNSSFVFNSRYQFHTHNWIKHKNQVKSDKMCHADSCSTP